MNSSVAGLLHTKSTHEGVSEISIDNILQSTKKVNLQSRIRALEAKEESVYAKMRCKNIEEFVRKIRELFQGEGEKDRQVFQFFENLNIKKALTHLAGGTTTSKRQDIIIEIKNPKNSLKIDLSKIDNKYIEIQAANEIRLNMGVDVGAAKRVVNEIFGTKLDPSTGNKRRINELLENPETLLVPRLQQEDELITVSSQKIADGKFSQSMLLPGSIFSYKKEDLDLAKKDPNIKNELKEAERQIYHYIWNASGISNASLEMKRAYIKVWETNIAGDLNNLALFEKGGYLNLLAGAFGEFSGALLMQYIDLKVGNSPFGRAYIANSLQSGEQAKADVTFMNGLGIQVKNYNPFSSKRSSNSGRSYSMLDTKTHPKKLSTYPDFQSGADSFNTFLANYFFNSSFQESHQSEFNELTKNLQDYFAEVSNFAVAEEVEDTVTFYFIEGKYFVPGSHILKAQYQKTLSSKPVSINGPTPIGGDEYFNTNSISGYWKRKKGQEWQVGSKNRSRFHTYISSTIKIESGFDYNTLPSLSTYALT